MTFHRSIVVIMACLIVSCAPKAEKPNAPARKKLQDRIMEHHGYTQNNTGSWTTKTDRRSPYENQGQSAYFDHQYEGKSFKPEGYSKKSWWGGKEMPRKAYQGKMETIDRKAAHLGDKQSNLRSSEYKTAAYDKTGSYETHASIENDAADIDKPSDAETDMRRRTYIKPKITEYEQQRSLSIEQSKKLLGN